MMKSSNRKLSRPQPEPPPETWRHSALYQRVREAVFSVPLHFQTETQIEGISATDIFTLNTALGATIEEQVVDTLNRIRSVWDPDEEYSLYGFVRQAQRFPDVVLRKLSEEDNNSDIIMGIELKGWYLISKEGEPSFRFNVSASACAPQDLLVVVPWALKNVLSGPPRLFRPYVQPSRYAAEIRNYYWRHERDTKADRTISGPSQQIKPYPTKDQQIADRPASDAGGNFGRYYTRCGIMDEYTSRLLQERLCGIPAKAWLEFFKVFTDAAVGRNVRERIESLRKRFAGSVDAADATTINTFQAILGIIENHVP